MAFEKPNRVAESLWMFSTGRISASADAQQPCSPGPAAGAAPPILCSQPSSWHTDVCPSATASGQEQQQQLGMAVALPPARAPTGHGLTTAVSQLSVKAPRRNAKTKSGVAKELCICVTWSACLIFSASISPSPFLAMPCLLLFFTLSCLSLTYPPYLTSSGSQFRELDLIRTFLVVFYITCLHLSTVFSSPCSSLSFSQKRKKCTMTSVLTITQPFHCGSLAGPGLRHTWLTGSL